MTHKGGIHHTVIANGTTYVYACVIIRVRSTTTDAWIYTLYVSLQKEHVLIRLHAFCTVSDQNLDFLSHMSICRKYFSRFLHNLKTIYEYNYIEKPDLGKHYLLLLNFPDDVTNKILSYRHTGVTVEPSHFWLLYDKSSSNVNDRPA